jgi:hypothetical protein
MKGQSDGSTPIIRDHQNVDISLAGLAEKRRQKISL